jgi:hypothetical protein
MMGRDVCLPAVVRILSDLVNLRIVKLWHPYRPPPPRTSRGLRSRLNVPFLAPGTGPTSGRDSAVLLSCGGSFSSVGMVTGC